MEERLRPDLSRILPRPALHRLVDPQAPFATASAPAAAAPDFLIDVRQPAATAPGEVGFGLAVARTVADRVATWFAHVDRGEREAVQRPDRDRVRMLTDDPPGRRAAAPR